MESKQLFEKQSNQYKPFFPIVRLEDIVDKISDKSIQWILNTYNHIYVEYSESAAITRNKVPTLLRRTGLWITYNVNKEIITEYYKGDNKDVQNYLQWTMNDNWERFDKIKHLDGSIEYQHLSETLKELIGNDNTITNFPDDEDLEVRKGVLKFKDKEYDTDNFSGLGRVILRKNLKIIDNEAKNVLTQSIINKSNTIYIIQYDYDLNGAKITIPEGCVLDFQGGSLINGTIVFNNTFLKSYYECIDCNCSGTIRNDYVYSGWFKNSSNFSNNFRSIVNISNNSFKPILFKKDRYVLDDSLDLIVIKQSVDFNDATIVLNIEKKYCRLQFSNSEYVESTDYELFLDIINNKKNFIEDTKYRDCFIEIKNSTELELVRNLAFAPYYFYKTEYIYVDKHGYILNDFYNDNFAGVDSVKFMNCNVSGYIKNCNLEINDNYETEASVERTIGFDVQHCANVKISNINFNHKLKTPRLSNRFLRINNFYNVEIDGFRSTNTLNTTGSYVISMGRGVKSIMRNITTSGNPSEWWGIHGANYLTDVIVSNCEISRFDTHHRLNNAIVEKCTFYHEGIRITGWGDFIVRDCKFNCFLAISTRYDYGSYWDGDILIESCTFNNVYSVFSTNPSNWDFKGNNRVNRFYGKNITIKDCHIYNQGDAYLIGAFVAYSESDLVEERQTRLYADSITLDNITAEFSTANKKLLYYRFTAAEYRIVAPNQEIKIYANNIKTNGKDTGSDKGLVTAYAQPEDIEDWKARNNIIKFYITNVYYPLYLKYDFCEYYITNSNVERFGDGGYKAILDNCTHIPRFAPICTGDIIVKNCFIDAVDAFNYYYNFLELDRTSKKIYTIHTNIKVYSSILGDNCKSVLNPRGLYGEDLSPSTVEINSPQIGDTYFNPSIKRPMWWNGTSWVKAVDDDIIEDYSLVNIGILYCSKDDNYLSIATLHSWETYIKDEIPLAIVLSVGDTRIGIGLQNTQLPMSNVNSSFNYAKPSFDKAFNDWDGKNNSQVILNATTEDIITNTTDYAVGYCNTYSALNQNGNGIAEGEWYLPSLAELCMISSNVERINYISKKIGLGSIIRYTTAFSSTEKSLSVVWGNNIYGGKTVQLNKTSSFQVIPVCSLDLKNNYTEKPKYPSVGQYYFNETSKVPMWWNGESWKVAYDAATIERIAFDNVLIVYCDTTDNLIHCIHPTMWKSYAADQTPLGLLIGDEKKIVVALNYKPSINFSSSAKVTSGFTTRSIKEAVNDWNGYFNTQKAIELSSDDFITNTEDYAPGYCNNYSAVNENGYGITQGQWYLPSIAELVLIINNIEKINNVITFLEVGEPINQSTHLSSTQFGEYSIWALNMWRGDISGVSKSDPEYKFMVRPVSNILSNVEQTFGKFNDRPSSPSVGFEYFCTDRKTAEGTTNGIMIYHKGNNVWVDALGRVVE